MPKYIDRKGQEITIGSRVKFRGSRMEHPFHGEGTVDSIEHGVVLVSDPSLKHREMGRNGTYETDTYALVCDWDTKRKLYVACKDTTSFALEWPERLHSWCEVIK